MLKIIRTIGKYVFKALNLLLKVVIVILDIVLFLVQTIMDLAKLLEIQTNKRK